MEETMSVAESDDLCPKVMSVGVMPDEAVEMNGDAHR